MNSILTALCLWGISVRAGSVLWSGFFNSSSKVSDFDVWSFSNEIGNWQWYIHGSSPSTNYLALSPSNKNPADTTDAQGIKTTIDGTSFWNGQTMERTEIIPQTKANLGAGHLYYHFSLMTSTTNAPNPGFEHQIAFFESHCAELKFGLISGEQGTTDTLLRWDVGGVTHWSTPLQANNWYNFAYDINFSAGTIGLWASNGSSGLTQIVAPVAASPSTNSADWHIGVLRLPNGGTNPAPEDWYWCGIYVEQAPITTSVAGPAPGSGRSTPPPSSTSSVPTTSPTSSTTPPNSSTSPPSSTSTANGPTQTHWGQCGGNGWGGPTICASPFKCVVVSPPYYSQCQ